MVEEMKLHVELQTERNRARGIANAEARDAALREFGNVAAWQERAREARPGLWLENLVRDLADAGNSLCRSPGWATAVTATLAVGMGIALFSLDVSPPDVLRREPYPDADRLYLIGSSNPQVSLPARYNFIFSAEFARYQTQASAFEQFAAVRLGMANARFGETPVPAETRLLSSGCLPTFGVTCALGRPFAPGEYGAGHDQVVLLSHQFWSDHFGSDPGVIGQTLVLDEQACTIVGVLPAGQKWPFYFHADVYRPMPPIERDPAVPIGMPLFVIGKLKSGLTPQQGASDLARVLAQDLPVELAPYLGGSRPYLLPLRDWHAPARIDGVIPTAGLLLWMMAVLNAVNLVLARLAVRQREWSIRLALGATWWRVARLCAIEAILPVVAAGAMAAAAVGWLFPVVETAITARESAMGGGLDGLKAIGAGGL
jgi:hypothetical protein